MLKKIKEWLVPKDRSGLAEVNHTFIGVIIVKELLGFLRKLEIIRGKT